MKMFSPVPFKTTATGLLRPAALALLLCVVVALPATAQLITLAPVNVIGGSPTLGAGDNPTNFVSISSTSSGTWQPGEIFNQQTGAVDGINFNPWLPAGVQGGGSLANRYAVINLGAPYFLSQIELFNSANTYRGTATFNILASNTIGAASTESGFSRGQELTGTIATLLGSTALSYANWTGPGFQPTTQTFAISSSAAYQYVQITLLTAQSATTVDPTGYPVGTYPTLGSGLAEARIYGSLTAIPEPSTYAAIAGIAMLGFAVWRRRSRKNSPAVAASAAAA